MAEMTEAERQMLYQADCDIINRQADAKQAKLKAAYDKVEARHLAAVEKKRAELRIWADKKKVGIKAEWDRRLSMVPPGRERTIAIINEKYDGLEDIVELDMEQRLNGIIENDMRNLDQIEENMKRDIEDVDVWRSIQLNNELIQLTTHRQRPRKP